MLARTNQLFQFVHPYRGNARCRIDGGLGGTFDHRTQSSNPMEIHSVTFRLTSYLGLLLITAVTSLTTAWVQADDAIRKGISEKTKSVSAAMESSLEGLPKLCESVSKRRDDTSTR